MSLDKYLSQLRALQPGLMAQLFHDPPVEVSGDRRSAHLVMTECGHAVIDQPHRTSILIDSEVLKIGPKVIQLGQTQAEAMENTTLSLSWQDYRQPFPAMIVDLPRE
jgi:hypothetical protein